MESCIDYNINSRTNKIDFFFFFNSGETKHGIEIEHKQTWDLQFIFLVYYEIGPS